MFKMDASAERLMHAYIISGGTEDAREAYAEFVAKTAVCSGAGKRPCGACVDCRKAEKKLHPDISYIEKKADKTELTIDIMRGVRSDAFVMPNEAERKVYIIRGADNMNEETQNAILKVLEEPPKFVVFLLLAENPQRLLSTVRSRCALVSVGAEKRGAAAENAAKFVAAAEKGNKIAITEAVMATEKIDKAEYDVFLQDVKRAAVDAIRAGGDGERLMKLIAATEEAERYRAVNVGRVHITGLFLSRLV